MRHKSIICIMALCALVSVSSSATGTAAGTQDSSKPVYKDPAKPVEERVEDLLSRMTLHEKVMQLVQYVTGRNDNPNNRGKSLDVLPAEAGSVIYMAESPELRNIIQRKCMEESRLGIPMVFAYDAIHGFRTIYPIALAQACSWNPALVEKASAVSARECRESGIDWTFSPMIDVAHDPRWGRVSEGYGEDPYANGVFAAAAVKGFQGDDMSAPDRVAACLKHFVGYGASEAGRDYVYTEISRQTLWDTYLLPFKMGLDAGAATLMSCFNNISGIPGSANPYILTEILRNRWHSDAPVVSDWSAIQQLRAQGMAADHKEAAELAFNAGNDIDMMSECYDRHLEDLVHEGKVSMSTVDAAVRRVLALKFRLGLFENPYIPESTEAERFLRPEELAVVQKLAEESMVLLKNEGDVLPIKTGAKIAVIGPEAKDGYQIIGSWGGHGREQDAVTFFQGLSEEFSSITYAKGCDYDGNDRSGFDEAVKTASEADVVVLCMGEKQQWSGENASRSTIRLPEIQEELVKAVKAAGKPVVLVLVSGRPLEIRQMEPYADAILEAWEPGIMGGKALAGIISGRVNPSGRLAMTFPYSTGQIPIYYNRRPSGRSVNGAPYQGKYQDIQTEPMYEFGYGLSYTTYSYGELRTSASTIRRGDKVRFEVTVSNSGSVDGDETVHFFIQDPVSRITRPMKELKHFEKHHIAAGDAYTYVWEMNPEKDLSFVDSEGNKVLEDGDFYVIVKDRKVKLTLVSEAENNSSFAAGVAGVMGKTAASMETNDAGKGNADERGNGDLATATGKTIRILAIGNSFSEDAIENNLYELFKADGQEVIIGNLYIGGCSLERHWDNIEGDKAEYRYREIRGGHTLTQKKVRLSTALAEQPWDYVSIQQASGISGMYETVSPYVDKIIAYVKANVAGSPKIIWHQTWSYSKDSDHKEFVNYGKDQMKMYNAIVDVTRKVQKDSDVDLTIPCGTAIQNARTSSLGDTLNRDGYHLDKAYGRYTAACTWFEAISGHSVVGNSYRPASLTPEQQAIAQQAAHFAVRKPYKVTKVKL